MASLDELKKKYLPQQSTQTTPVRNEAEPQSAAPTGNASESYLDRLKKKYIPTVDQNYINSFMTDADSFLGSAQRDYGSISPETVTSVYSTRRQTASDLRKRAFAIRQYLDDNKGSIEADKYDSLISYLDNYDKVSNQSMMDFAAAMKSFDTTGMSGYDAFMAEKQEKEQKEDDKTWWEKALAAFAHTSDSTLPAAGVTEAYHGYREDTTYREPDERWNDDQRNTFGYLYAIDPERAYEYALEVNNALNAGEKQEKLDKISDSAKDNKVGHTLGAIAASPLGLADYLSDLTESAARGTITQKEFVTPFEYSQAATGAIAQDLNEKGGTIDEDVFILGGKGWGDVYSLGFSAAQSLISAYTLGGTGTLVTFIGIGGAAGVDDALARGATPDQALLYGSIVGAAEGAAEMINADNLIKITSSKTLSKYLLAMLNQGLGESVEEGATAIIENVADNIIMADKSNYHAAVEAYISAGMTEEEAKRKAWTDMVGEVLYSAMGGFVTGAGNAAVVGGVKNTMENAEAKKLYGESQQELVAEGRESAEGSESRKLADKYQQKLDRGKNLSGAQLSRLVDANERQFVAEDMANIKQAVEARLTELGEVDAVSELADILAKQAAGQSLSKAEQSRLESSRYGKRVANELNPENVRSGEYTSGWAQGIETNRINVDEYNRIVEAAQTAQEAQTPAEVQEVTEVENAVQAEDLPAVEPVAEVPAEAAEDVAAVEEAPAAEAEEEAEPAITLEDASTKYGAQAGAMVHTYTQGQDVAKYDRAYGHAYDMGKSGVALSYVMNSEATAYLTEQQRELAYAAGKAASDTSAREQAEKNAKAANGKTGRKRGVVRGEGVNIADLRKSFNDTQGTAYKVLSTYAEATGIDIVLYKSEANADGDFEGAQGKFKWSEDTIYIDINAGLANVKSVNDLAKYAMLRTFSHEFTHFLEKWNPVRYNEFRRVVFDALTERGENVHDLIEEKMAQNTGMEYDAASREVVAEAMTDILPDTTFVHTLAEKHKSIFDKLLERLKEFAADLKKYFSTIGHNRDRGANALKEQVGEAVKYVDSIVKLFDEVALEAVENYQRTVAIEEAAVSETEQVEDVDPNGLTEGEHNALMVYKSGGSYTLNAKLRGDVILDEHEQYIVDNLVSALEKLPVYKGKVYRNIQFDGFGDKAARDAFVRSHVIGEWITYEGFTSTSTAVDGYPLDGNFVVHMEIESVNGRDLSGYGNNFESEVLLTHPSQFIPNKIEYAADGTPTIYLMEVAYGQEETKPQTAHGGGNQGDVSRDHSGESRQREASDIPDQGEVQRLHTSHSGDGEVQPAVPERDTVGNRDKQGDLQGVQAEVSTAEGDAFTITDNHEFGTLEIKFDGKPAEAIREVLKAHKFRWHGKKGIWYGKTERADIVRALREAYQAEAPAKEEVKKPSDFETAFWNATQEERDEVIDAINENTKLTHMRPTELRGETPTNIEEVTEHVETEHADNGRSVLEPDTDGQGTARLLDESQDADVSGAAQEREALGAAGQRESSTGRDGDRPDAGAGDSRSDGSGESGDLRRDELTAEATAAAEQLQTVVEEQIEQKSTEEPKGSNFVIDDSLNLPDGEKARFHANVAAIRLIKQLESEGRFATEAEQEVLSKYIGWGGLDKAFGEYRFNRETRKSEMAAKDGWEKEFAELRSLVDDGIITEQEYKDMSASTKNAHYTSIEVIKAMYDGLAGLGFKGGRMLEPSSGVGNFVGAMPTEMSAKVNSWTMVELDRVTGLIAKYLYPNADVRIQGFETANIPDNYMDVAIGNVPFGNFGVVDRAYPKRITKAIHNYFFAKSIDKVRPGGIVMFITSSFTMNASDTTVRQYMMERADLLGAIRLPNTAFKGNAGTEVVTDILILKKRESGTEYAGEDFLEADYDSNYGTYTSNYFKNHPEMVLGKPVVKRGMYGSGTLTFEPFTDRGTIDEQIREAFKHIKGEMSYPAQRTPEKTNFAVEKAGKKAKAGGFVVHADGSISQNRNGQLVKVDTDEKTAKRIAGMLGIRDAYKTLANYLQQGVEAKYIKQARTALNKAYDAFVAEYGYLNSIANRKAIDSDPDSYSILSLENFDPKKKTAKKADIFTKDTISANKTVTHADSVSEGVIASINLTGGVDAELIARLTDRTVEDVTREIIESRVAFKTRGGALVARESYLSGNVRAKLREAEALLPFDKDYAHNVEELRRVIPADIPYNEIYITPGNAFIPNEVYADFIAHMLGGRNYASSYSAPDVEVGRTTSGDFKIVVNNKRLKNSHYNTQTWGTARKSFLDLIDAMMGSRAIRVNDTMENADGKKISVLNEAETEAANEKAKAIQKEFEEWVWQDEERRTALARLYNETFNAIVNPKYDGSHLSVNGINADFSLRPHQANAVHRIISSGGNTLLAHRVGAGKTLEMAAAAMKLRELGVVKKPVFVVPKSLVAQWGVEFHSYFPASRLLVADDKSFTPANRRIFTNQIANGDFDAVIVSYEQFEKIPMSVEYQQRFYEEQIDEIIAAIAEEKAESRDGKGMTVKEMEKKKAQLEKKLKELTSKPKDEDNINFEMLGIDSLFVDEAHNFKNLEYVSKMSNVAGLGSAKGSQRAFDLYTKIRYLQGLNGGRGIVFATATPVMNSMVELYIMQKYLQPDILDRLGLKSFDAWAKQFGEVVNKWEINPSGTGMRQKQVFANFRNLNELQLLFRSFSDVLTEVPGLKIPKMKGGAVKIVECEPGEFQKNYMQELQKRAENVKSVDPSVDNMLKITSDGRKVSYTQRMIDPSLPYEPGSKIFRAADNVLAEYKASADIKGTQIVFLDMATPKGTDKSKADAVAEDSTDESYDEESARLYDDMRDYLAKKGIPRKEIAFIHEADSDAKRKQLFEDVNNGKVRVLIGSTGKMGVGMNAQKRIVAIHHLDAPWRPGDVEQRDGRAFRQKNMNEEVSKYVYVTKGSFDSRLWDILDRKQHFINQIMNGEDVGRTAEDTGEVTLSAAEVKALASGNPLIEEQTKLTDEIKKLENLLKAYHSSIRLAKTKLSDDEQNIALHKNRIAQIREDIGARVDTYSEGKFSMTVGKQVFTDKKDAGAALITEIMAKAGKDAYVTVGKFAGFELKAIRNGAEFSGLIHGKGSYKFNVYVSNTTRMVGHIGEIIAGFENMIKYSEQVISDATSDRAVQQEILAKPFEKQDELNAKRARFNEVMEQLAPKTEQQYGNDIEQEQSRAYLGDIDSEYMDAVDSGDMETAQRMVDEAARKAGYKHNMYHGSHARFTVFDHEHSGGLFNFTEDKQAAKTYAFGGGGGRGADVIAVDDNGIAWEYDEDLDAYVAVGSVNDFWESDSVELSPVPKEYETEVRTKNYVHNRLANWEDDGEYMLVPKTATTGEYYIKAENTLDLVNDKETAKQVFRTIAKKFTESGQNFGELRRSELGSVINRILWSYQNDYDDFWGITKQEYAHKAFKDFIVPELKRMGYDSIYHRDDSHKTYAVFDSEQIKSANAVTYDDNGDVIPLSKRFSSENDDVRYQQRTDTLTDRDVLALAAQEIKVDDLSAGEQDALRIFRERLSKLEQLEEERAEQGRLYKEQQFGAKPDRAAAEATLNRMHVLDGQIAKASTEVLDVEDKKVLKTVLQKARKVVEAEERAHGQELLARWRDRRNNAAAIKKYRDRLRGDVDELTNWVLHPDNKDIVKRIPDALKNSVIPFLSSINFMSKQAIRGKKGNTKADGIFIENMKKLNAALKNNIDINGLYSGYNDLPPNFMENLQRFIDSTEALVKKNSGEFIINKMTAEELQELSKVVRTLKKYIMQVNRFHYNAMYQHVFQAGDNTIETLKEMDAAKGTGKISEFLMWQQIRPAYAFERFGEGGKSIYDGLRRGQAQLAFNTQKIVEFSEKTYTAAEVQAWEKELKTFYVGGDKLQIPVSTIMSIYRLSKDPEARYHMEGDGFRVATYTHDGKKISDVGHRFTTGEINQIIRALTPRQREVADRLQGFMAEQGGKWGNYVSVARFGEELFTNKDYFPINSDGRHLAGNTDEEHPSAAALYALLNMSFTKSRKEKAKNRIVVYSIFDVFANHMASMAQYNAMALPILDAVKWFHYQQVWIDEEGNKEVIGNVREQMARVYGVPEETRPGKGNAGYAVSFVENIIKAFNGTEAQGIPTDETGLSALRRYNMAQVAFNFRVVVQQPLAITRAGMLVDYRSILRGLKANPATIRKNIEEMREHSGIAAWKALGFYDINISRGLTDIIKHKSTLGDKISDVGMWGAEKADILTWAAMWSAAKEEIRRKMHLSEEDARYYEEVTKLFEDIIYKTQVVDSVLTKNEFLRSKGAFARLVGSFMSEPTTTASMMIDAYDKYQADMQRGMDRRQAWEENKRRIGRLAYVYGLSAVMLAAVQAVADAWRDDDDYQTFLEKWLEAFGGNMVDELMPINKLPILSDFYELVKSMLEALGMDTYGNPPQSVFMQWRDSLVKGTEIIYQKISGEDTNYTWYGGAYKLLQAASGMVGLPMAAATRELVSVWNSTVGSFAPSLKVKSYEPSELAQIRYAYEDGHLTAEEVTEQLLAKGLVDNEDEAYFTIAGWEAGEGYSRYDAMYEAIRNGGNVDEALAELTSHGYTEEEVFSQVKGQIGKWYRDGEISKAQAVEMLTKYSHHFGMDSDEITATVNRWSAKVVTGIDYNDIGDEYKAGKITASRAIEMYMRYGGLTREEAQQKVTLIDFVKKHPTLEGISYAAVESYKEHAEGAGITAETFYDVWKYNSETQADVDASGKAISGSKKDKVLSYIHSMRLTAAQKDSLYYAFGWAQSKINEAPWR